MLDYIQNEKQVKLHDWNIIAKPKNETCDMATELFEKSRRKRRKSGPAPITWTVNDLAKAGSLLAVPPKNVSFEDEQEMRRVYTLIYDVFRYKNVLMEALNEVDFFRFFPKLLDSAPHVWLLFYDLYHRSFKKRDSSVAALVYKLFDEAGLSYTENALWSQRIKLAASISRIRIKRNALTLNELLPAHLKDEKITEVARNAPVTCWINSKKVEKVEELCREIEEEFKFQLVTNAKFLERNCYKWDAHCPQIIAFHSSARQDLAKSSFIRSHKLIVQDRSFCLGPATFDKVITELELTGSVIQTHVNSPRTTAYLANLLSHNEKIKKLMAFSAGQRKSEYEKYFNQLGMKNILIFSDRLIDSPPDAHYMEEVVAVFATPPNSYSAVTDPVDLVCSRGGDLSMLEALTEAEESKEGKDRIQNILDEQKRTLKFAMSRPQIQFILYETHSELEAENQNMVQKALFDINRIAKLQHASLQGKISASLLSDANNSNEVNNNNNTNDALNEDSAQTTKKIHKITPEYERKILESINVPETDLFDTLNLPCLCPNDNLCHSLKNQGCYLALIQRKQVIRLDDKYMIQMAENRGLFGSTTSTISNKPKGSRYKKRSDKQDSLKTKKKPKQFEINRIAAPTHAFLGHTINCAVEKCPRCHVSHTDTSQYRRWWSEATHHILSLRSNLIKKKIIPKQSNNTDVKSVLDNLRQRTIKIDEIVAKSNKNDRFPIFPKLKLSRDNFGGKVKVPLAITNVIMPIPEENQFYY